VKFLIDMPLSPALLDGFKRATIARYTLPNQASNEHLTADYGTRHRGGSDNRYCRSRFSKLVAISHFSHPGVILFRSGDFNEREMLENMERALDLIPENGFSNALVIVERHRIRRIRLPLGAD
jgi:predicted nuclease of predicted toxin-antitoxin system